jgi:hypothetical protein
MFFVQLMYSGLCVIWNLLYLQYQIGVSMLRFSVLTAACLTLAACGQSAEVASQLGDQAKAKLTAVGESVQAAQKQAAEALPEVQDKLEDTTDAAKEALTAVGNTTVAVGQTASKALTAVGTTVMDVTGQPAPEKQASTQPQQPANR